MIVTRGFSVPSTQERRGGRISVHGYGRGIRVIFYAFVTSSTAKSRSQSSFEQLLISNSQENSMLVGTFATNQTVDSYELDNTQASSRVSTDSSSTMDDMDHSSHEESQSVDSREPELSRESNEYDETQATTRREEGLGG